ncbi:MAG: DUF1326 domain-containing protein [Candidatus Brocadiales bacterium]|nr:DUF1326 domain-containing protein [Candidatus Brocadiales bacterium]
MKRIRYVMSGLVALTILSCVYGAVYAGTTWSISGEYFEGCTCNPGCPCLFGSEPTHNKTCRIAGVFHIQKGNYGQYSLDGQTVIGITDLTATPDKNWIVFYIDDKKASAVQINALLDIFQNRVFDFAKVPQDRITVRYLPVSVESSEWRKKAVAGDRLTLDVELLHGAGDTGKPTQIVNKNFSIWSKEFDLTLDMGKATTHRFNEDKYEWNYDGRSGFATKFHFTSD